MDHSQILKFKKDLPNPVPFNKFTGRVEIENVDRRNIRPMTTNAVVK